MRRALERHKRGEAQVVPILLRPVDYSKAPFARLEILPTNGKPVTSWRDRERAFVDIALALERLALILLPRILPERMIENEVPPATVRETLYQQYEPTIIPARAPDFNIPHAPIGLAEQLQKEGTPVTAPWHAGTPGTAPGAGTPVTAPGYAGTPVTAPGYAETPVITRGSSHARQRFRRQLSLWTPTLVYLVGLFCILFLIFNNPNLLQFLNGFFLRVSGPLATVLGFIVGGIITILYSLLFVKASTAYRKLKEVVRRRKEQKQAIRVREELLRIEEANRRAEAARIREETFRKHAEEARQQEQEAAREEAYVRLYYLEALKAYEQALLSNNEDAIAYRGKGNALAGLGRLDEAILAFERANELAPRASNAMRIGNVFARLRQFDKAIIAYKQAMELDNKFVLDFHEMSETLQQQGDAEAAQRIDEYAKQHGYHD